MRPMLDHQMIKRAALAVTFLILVGAMIAAPSVSYADTPVARIDHAPVALAPAPTTAPPPTTLMAPDSSLGRQALAGRSGRLSSQVTAIATFALLGLSIRAPEGATVLVRVHRDDGWGEWQPLDFD